MGLTGIEGGGAGEVGWGESGREAVEGWGRQGEIGMSGSEDRGAREIIVWSICFALNQ